MTRRALSICLALAATGVVAPAKARAGEDPRVAANFIQGLRERGYYDLALDYLTSLRNDKDTPPELRARLDFDEGRALVDAATHGSDPDVARKQFDRPATGSKPSSRPTPARPRRSRRSSTSPICCMSAGGTPRSRPTRPRPPPRRTPGSSPPAASSTAPAPRITRRTNASTPSSRTTRPSSKTTTRSRPRRSGSTRRR
jgi:hypothetical protein